MLKYQLNTQLNYLDFETVCNDKTKNVMHSWCSDIIIQLFHFQWVVISFVHNWSMVTVSLAHQRSWKFYDSQKIWLPSHNNS